MESQLDYYRAVKELLLTSIEEDWAWLSHGRVPGQKPDPVRNPWMPFQVADFVAMLTECVAYSEGARFMDVGSGIGTKMAVANKLFGLCSVGIECDEEMVKYAASLGRSTLHMDCMHESAVSLIAVQDIIWMYRPFRDGFKQAQLEHRIFECMKPGAVVVGAQWENQPSGFEIIVDDWDTGHRGAWKKPLNWKPETYEINEDAE